MPTGHCFTHIWGVPWGFSETLPPGRFPQLGSPVGCRCSNFPPSRVRGSGQPGPFSQEIMIKEGASPGVKKIGEEQQEAEMQMGEEPGAERGREAGRLGQ